MDELPFRLKTFLQEAAEQLRAARLPAAQVEAMDRLSAQVDEPCVVAVVGRMKSGKSTFINALLGEDLAKVGVTETTATINYFRYGRTDPARSVRCYWQNGTVTEEDPAFLDSLQGNDAETLRRASGIKYLEYHLLNPYLESFVLVDTPGTSAVVDEHVERTAEFLGLRGQLRDRHDAETRRLGSEADAVVYLVGQVARATDQAFLEEFAEVTGGRSRALNAVGVLSKIDLDPEGLRRRDELASKIGAQLKGRLNAVVPVSAGIRRAVDRLRERGESGIADFLGTLRRIPSHRLEKFLYSEEFFRELEPEDCPVSTGERAQLLGDMPWAVFTTMVRAAISASFDPAATEAEWRSLSGFDRLDELLKQHFFLRARFLRCYRIVGDARKLLNEIRFKHLPEQRQRDREQRAKFDRFLTFVRGARGDPTVAKELGEFLVAYTTLGDRSDRIEAVREQLDRRLSEFVHELEEMNADFEALRLLEGHADSLTGAELEEHERLKPSRPAEPDADSLTGAELEELRALFGLYSLGSSTRVGGRLDVVHLRARQEYWREVAHVAREPDRRLIADRAVACYGAILSEIAAESSPISLAGQGRTAR